MAATWTARVDSIALSDLTLQVGVSYYDAADTGFTNQLYSTTLQFSADTAPADIKADILNIGAGMRAAQAQRDALIAAYPIASTYTVAAPPVGPTRRA